MVTLMLFRHAKSSWDRPGLADFDRPLAERGRRAAPLMGRYMEKQGIVPGYVACSTAVRARETLELAVGEWSAKPRIAYEDGLYHASPATMLAMARSIEASYERAMLVGHNPGMHRFAVELCGGGDGSALRRLNAKFPTAGLAIITADCAWGELEPGTANLDAFCVPSDLE